MYLDPVTLEPVDDLANRRSLLPRARSMVAPGGTLTNTVQPGQMLPGALRARAEGLRKQVSDMESAEPDTSALQAFAKQQGQAADTATLGALAAQYAGEQFQPVQAQLLRQAAAAREPMKMAGGMLTPEGQFLADPFSRRDRRISALERQAVGLETQATTLETAADRLAEQRRRNLSDEALRGQAEETRRMLAESRLNQPDSKAFTRATNLRNELTKRSDKIQEGTRHAETVLTLLTDPTIAQDPTKQVSLVFAFGKMLDPESVVRESEYALIAQARGMFESLLQKPDQIMTGARLAPNQLASMRQIAQQLFAGSTQRRNDLMEYYRGIAQRNNIPVEDVLPMGASAAPGGGGPAVDDPLGMRRKPK